MKRSHDTQAEAGQQQEACYLRDVQEVAARFRQRMSVDVVAGLRDSYGGPQEGCRETEV